MRVPRLHGGSPLAWGFQGTFSTSHFKNLAGSPMLALMRRTELTDQQWQHLHPLLPPLKSRGRPRADDRKTLNGILYVLRTGCRWEDVPREYGSPVTCWRRLRAWEEDGTWERVWRSLLAALDEQGKIGWARRRGLEPFIRRMIVELKAEHPKLNANEIANIVYVRTGRRLGKHTPARILAEEVIPLKLSRLFEPYHETEDVKDAREAVVALHLDGWSVKAVASYMRVSRTTVYRVLGRWTEEGEAGLEDRPSGRPKGVRKVDLATMDFIRRVQENPELGAFRVHAALKQKRGTEVSVRTVGRIMAVHRSLYGLGKPKRSPHQKKAMPFRAKRRHEIWTADVRYVDHNLPPKEHEGNVYAISVLENYSRLILASAISSTQDVTRLAPCAGRPGLAIVAAGFLAPRPFAPIAHDVYG